MKATIIPYNPNGSNNPSRYIKIDKLISRLQEARKEFPHDREVIIMIHDAKGKKRRYAITHFTTLEDDFEDRYLIVAVSATERKTEFDFNKFLEDGIG